MEKEGKGLVFEFHKESANATSNGKINGGWSSKV